MHESEAPLREPRWPDEPPLRVCLLVGGPGSGGPDRQWVLLAEGLRRRGVEVTVGVLGEDGAGATGPRGVDVVAVGLQRDRPLWSNLSALGRLVRHLRRTRTDVLHALSFDGRVLGPPLARLAGVPVVITGRPGPADRPPDRRWMRAAERLAPGMTDLVMADGIQAVLGDPAAADRMARQAQAWTRQFLGVDVMVDQHLDAYTDLLARA